MPPSPSLNIPRQTKTLSLATFNGPIIPVQLIVDYCSLSNGQLYFILCPSFSSLAAETAPGHANRDSCLSGDCLSLADNNIFRDNLAEVINYTGNCNFVQFERLAVKVGLSDIYVDSMVDARLNVKLRCE